MKVTVKLAGAFYQQPEDYGAIVIGKFDQSCLGDGPAQFDQLARARGASRSRLALYRARS